VNFVTPASIPGGSDSPAAAEGAEPRRTRDERRRRTEAAILEAARELFADLGFERTTIRAVAGRAGIDPALVMQHFGSKEKLFAASARWHLDRKKIAQAERGDLARTALEDVFRTLEDPEQRDAAVALLRNCLTHASARDVLRDEVIRDTQAAVAATIGGPDGELRAALLGSTVVGLTIGRYLLEIPALTAASRDDLERVLGPVLAQLVGTD
jgi:AcrR family transcriptional regulator